MIVFPDEIQDEENEEDDAEGAFAGVFLTAARAGIGIAGAFVFAVRAFGHGNEGCGVRVRV